MTSVLHTDRLRLRPFAQSDFDGLHALFTDPVVMRYWDEPAWDASAKTQAVLDQFMRDAPDVHLEYAVDLDGAFIGRVGLWRRDEIGYIFRPDHWGKGYAREAVRALVDQVFLQFQDTQIIHAEADPRNTGSVTLLTRLGFVQTGMAEKNFHYGGIEWCDTAYFALERGALRGAASAAQAK